MNNRESPLFWSIPCGTWYDTHVRVSVFFPIIVLIICFRLKDVQLGLAFSAILFASVLLHEIGHIIAARLTGGSGREILIWPLGGLAAVQPAPTFKSRLMTPAAGPLTNFALCGITLWAVLHADRGGSLFNPLQFPIAQFSDAIVSDLLILTFWSNFVLLVLNLIPVFPMDGGRMLHAVLANRYGSETAVDVYLRVGVFCSVILLLAGLLFDNTWLVTIGSFMLVLNVMESIQVRSGESYDESFMGYDFSQGYTSLERGDETRPPRRGGPIRRWREKRRTEKLRQEQEREAEAARQLDTLLDKVHQHGIESLTDAERRQLNRVSARYRDKGPSPG